MVSLLPIFEQKKWHAIALFNKKKKKHHPSSFGTYDAKHKFTLTLIWVGGNFTPCWFSLNNSKTVKVVTPESVMILT